HPHRDNQGPPPATARQQRRPATPAVHILALARDDSRRACPRQAHSSKPYFGAGSHTTRFNVCTVTCALLAPSPQHWLPQRRRPPKPPQQPPAARTDDEIARRPSRGDLDPPVDPFGAGGERIVRKRVLCGVGHGYAFS